MKPAKAESGFVDREFAKYVKQFAANGPVGTDSVVKTRTHATVYNSTDPYVAMWQRCQGGCWALRHAGLC